MKQYNYLQALYMSFYSRELYRDVAKNWGMGVILYLLLVLLICWAVKGIVLQPQINKGFESFSNVIVPQIPAITLKDGQVKTPANKPYYIKDPDGKVFAIIDTSGKYTAIDEKNPIFFLLTKDTLMNVRNNGVEAHPIPPSYNFTIQPTTIQGKLETFVKWAWLILFPFYMLTGLIYRVVQGAVYSLIGKLFALSSKISLTYGQIFKLMMVALTPTLIIGMILDLFVPWSSYQMLFYFLLSVGYLFYAIRANKRTE